MASYSISDGCPSLEQLEGLAYGTAHDDGRVAILAHISGCRDCREIYESFLEADYDDVCAAEQDINARVDSRVAGLSGPAKPSGRVLRLVSKYAVAASILGLGIWGLCSIGSGQQGGAVPATSLADAGGQSGNAPVNDCASAGPASSLDQIVLKADSLMRAGNYEEAAGCLEGAISMSPGSSRAQMLLGVCRLRLHDYSVALGIFKDMRVETKEEARQVADYISECEMGLKKNSQGR